MIDARSWVVRNFALVMENDHDWCESLTYAAQHAVAHDMGTGYDRDAYEQNEHDAAAVVGLAIREVVRNKLEHWRNRHEISDDDAVWGLFLQLLDLGDREQWTQVGHSWLPDPADVRWPQDAQRAQKEIAEIIDDLNRGNW